MSGLLAYLRQQAALPEHLRDPLPPDETPKDAAARHEDMERRIDADIAEAESKPRPTPGLTQHVLEIPQAMLDAAGLEVNVGSGIAGSASSDICGGNPMAIIHLTHRDTPYTSERISESFPNPSYTLDAPGEPSV